MRGSSHLGRGMSLEKRSRVEGGRYEKAAQGKKSRWARASLSQAVSGGNANETWGGREGREGRMRRARASQKRCDDTSSVSRMSGPRGLAVEGVETRPRYRYGVSERGRGSGRIWLVKVEAGDAIAPAWGGSARLERGSPGTGDDCISAPQQVAGEQPTTGEQRAAFCEHPSRSAGTPGPHGSRAGTIIKVSSASSCRVHQVLGVGPARPSEAQSVVKLSCAASQHEPARRRGVAWRWGRVAVLARSGPEPCRGTSCVVVPRTTESVGDRGAQARAGLCPPLRRGPRGHLERGNALARRRDVGGDRGDCIGRGGGTCERVLLKLGGANVEASQVGLGARRAFFELGDARRGTVASGLETSQACGQIFDALRSHSSRAHGLGALGRAKALEARFDLDVNHARQTFGHVTLGSRAALPGGDLGGHLDRPGLDRRPLRLRSPHGILDAVLAQSVPALLQPAVAHTRAKKQKRERRSARRATRRAEGRTPRRRDAEMREPSAPPDRALWSLARPLPFSPRPRTHPSTRSSSSTTCFASCAFLARRSSFSPLSTSSPSDSSSTSSTFSSAIFLTRATSCRSSSDCVRCVSAAGEQGRRERTGRKRAARVASERRAAIGVLLRKAAARGRSRPLPVTPLAVLRASSRRRRSGPAPATLGPPPPLRSVGLRPARRLLTEAFHERVGNRRESLVKRGDLQGLLARGDLAQARLGGRGTTGAPEPADVPQRQPEALDDLIRTGCALGGGHRAARCAGTAARARLRRPAVRTGAPKARGRPRPGIARPPLPIPPTRLPAPLLGGKALATATQRGSSSPFLLVARPWAFFGAMATRAIGLAAVGTVALAASRVRVPFALFGRRVPRALRPNTRLQGTDATANPISAPPTKGKARWCFCGRRIGRRARGPGVGRRCPAIAARRGRGSRQAAATERTECGEGGAARKRRWRGLRRRETKRRRPRGS